MYTHYFQLKQSPFSIAPDPRYLFMSERHREALAHLLYGVGSGGGFVLLTGEIGAGKTTVCRCFMEQIPDNCQLAYIFNPKLSVEELLLSICEEFRIAPPAAAASVKTYVDAINVHLLASHAQGKNNVLIIDEAQNLSAAVLEQLRLLTNLETSERKLLQIILIGQPELRAMLARPELEQLAQRVIARYHLGSLSEAGDGQLYPPPPGRGRQHVALTVRAAPDGADPQAQPWRAAPHQPAVRPRAAGCLRGKPAASDAPDPAPRGRRSVCRSGRRRAGHGWPLALAAAGRRRAGWRGGDWGAGLAFYACQPSCRAGGERAACQGRRIGAGPVPAPL